MSKQLTPNDLKDLKNRSYTLYYHFRGSIPLTLHFEYDGGWKAAIERGILHCQRMNYRFIKVRPMIVDLDEREKRRNQEDNFENFE